MSHWRLSRCLVIGGAMSHTAGPDVPATTEGLLKSVEWPDDIHSPQLELGAMQRRHVTIAL